MNQSIPGNRPQWIPFAIACGSGCGLLLLLGIVAIVFAVRGASNAFQEADQVARQFLQYVSEKKDEKAYNLAASAWRNTSSLKDFQSFVSIWRQHQGTLKSAEWKGKWINSGMAGKQITLSYDVTGSKGNGQVLMLLVTEGGNLRIQACNFNPHSSGRSIP
jgi:hypothetical protein